MITGLKKISGNRKTQKTIKYFMVDEDLNVEAVNSQIQLQEDGLVRVVCQVLIFFSKKNV
jgi:hypothetical protein